MILESLQKTSKIILRVTNEDGKEVCKNIQLSFVGSCRFITSSLDKLAINLCDTSEFSVIKVNVTYLPSHFYLIHLIYQSPSIHFM